MTDDQPPMPPEAGPPPASHDTSAPRPSSDASQTPRGTPQGTTPPDARAQETLDGGLLETSVDVITSPVPTLRRITAVAPVGWATVVLVAVGFLSSFGQGPGMSGRFGDVEVGGGPGMAIGFAVASAILSPLFTLIGAAVVVLASRLLGGRAGWRSLYAGFGFANLPSAFGVLGAVSALIGTGGRILSGVLGFVLGVWVFILGVIAVREANGFSTGRAVAAVLLPVLAIVLLVGLLAILIAVAFGAAIAGS